MSTMNGSVPEVAEDDDLDAQLAAMREADRAGGEQPEDVTDDERSEPRETGAQAGQGDNADYREPLSADEWKQRHDNLQKALHAERSKRKENDEYRQKFAEIETRLAQLTPQERKDAKAEAEKRPDASKDPLAALDYALNKIEQYERQETERTQQTEAQRQQQAQLQRFASYVNEQETQFAEATPDYYDAVQWVRDKRSEHYQALGYTDAAASQQAMQEAQQLAVLAVRQQRSPAEVAYSYAKALGYAPSQQPAGDQKRDDAGRYQKMKDGQKASKTLSGPGAKVKTEATLESLIDMDDDPLEALHKGEESEFDRKFSAYARGARRA